MANKIFVILVCFLSIAKLTDAISCDEKKLQIEKKIEANKTLCAVGSTLAPKCCEKISREVEKHVEAYNASCPNDRPAACSKALGMRTGEIPDDAITASASIDRYYPFLGKSESQLNEFKFQCTWMALARVRPSWIQVDWKQVITVTGISTQGDCRSPDWVDSYSVSYWNHDFRYWEDYKESGTKKIFQGNRDQTSIVTHSFKYPYIQTRWIRVWPLTWKRGNPSMRIEFFGCRNNI